MNAAFTGLKRSGKTTLAFDIAMKNGGGIIIYDPKREWRGWPGTVSSVEEIPKAINDGNEIIVFHPIGDKREAFDPLAKFVSELHATAMEKNWDKAGWHFTFLVDESVNVSTAHFVDKNLLSLIAENRPEILDIFLTFQSPKDINNLLKTRIDTYFVFATQMPTDLEYLEKEVCVPKEDLEEIRHMRPHEYAKFTTEGGIPHVEYFYDPQDWFRPLEYFELNAQEREEVEQMSRDADSMPGWLKDLLDEFHDSILNFFEDEGYEIREPARTRSRGGESRDRDRSERRPRRENNRSWYEQNSSSKG